MVPEILYQLALYVLKNLGFNLSRASTPHSEGSAQLDSDTWDSCGTISVEQRSQNTYSPTATTK